METATKSAAVNASVYTLTRTQPTREIPVLAALQDKIDERLKTALYMSGTDNANAYFQMPAG